LDCYFGRKHKKKQVSARNVFDLNYYLYLCNSKIYKAHDSSIIHTQTSIKYKLMEKIIGRENEFGKLTDYMVSGKSEFIALYGRRRVGKTFLIRSFFKDQFDFYATGVIEGSRETEMEAFHNALVRYGYKGDKATSWIEAFTQLAELLERKNRNRIRR